MKRLVGWLLMALALAGAGSCGDNGTGPVAGELTVSLQTPNPGGDGALLFTVTGPDVLTSATASPGLRLFAQPLGAVTRFAVTGTLTNGAVLTIGVPVLSKAAQYTASVQNVATPDFQLRSLSGYSLTVAR